MPFNEGQRQWRTPIGETIRLWSESLPQPRYCQLHPGSFSGTRYPQPNGGGPHFSLHPIRIVEGLSTGDPAAIC